jgi:5-(hydroxymethyl)furfural/furfural oxidase
MKRIDHLIVGAGSAGSALAARLSEDPARQVTLLEAGADLRPASTPPEIRSANPHRVKTPAVFDAWCWPELVARRSAAQEPALYWRGRGLGGSSTVNGQIALHAAPEDYDGWRDAGCLGWGATDVFVDALRLEDDQDFGDRPYHGRGGPIPIHREPIERFGPLDEALRVAALDAGHTWAPDANAPEATGVLALPINNRDGVRISAADGYLEPARDRTNLKIRTDVLVDRVLLENGRATGVRLQGGEEIAAGEIILSAGAVASPAILMRSGLGPAPALCELGISVINDLPVGQTVFDHPVVGVAVELRPEARLSDIDHRHINCGVRYSSGLAGGGVNDMTIAPLNLIGYDDSAFAMGYLSVSVFQSFSSGRLTLRSTDPEDQPEINLEMLSDERDLVRLRDGLRRVIELARHPAYEQIAANIKLLGGASFAHADETRELDLDHVDDERSLDRWLRSNVADGAHVSGTCPMGGEEVPRRVLDSDCRVLGIDGLRVIDASVFPTIPRSNLHLPTLVVAEHMARRIRAASAARANDSLLSV